MRPNAPTLTMLGLETTCDETAAAVVRLTGERPEVLAEVAYDQFARHAPFGGVVPEIAARAHAEKIDHAVAAALAQAGIGFDGLDGVAASAGPGLIGGVMVGLVAAKAIALARGLPLIAVNHLEGHALSPRLGEPLAFPYLLLLVSGGHCQFLAVEGLGRYQRLGSTIDDAAGEAFDKAAKLLGLPQPGGPAIERAARAASAPERFALPRPLVGRPGCDLSFAGLKTALWRHVERLGALSDGDRADLAAAFQSAVVDCLAERAGRALERFAADHGAAGGLRFVAAGGVAANGPLRARLAEVAEAAGARFVAPPLRYCTDNGAMIALAGGLRLAAGLAGDPDAPARPRWPLDEAAARDRPTHKPGRKGAKA